MDDQHQFDGFQISPNGGVTVSGAGVRLHFNLGPTELLALAAMLTAAAAQAEAVIAPTAVEESGKLKYEHH